MCDVLLFSHVIPSSPLKTPHYHHPHLSPSQPLDPTPAHLSHSYCSVIEANSLPALRLSHGIVLLGTSLGRLPKEIIGVVDRLVAIAEDSDVSQ